MPFLWLTFHHNHLARVRFKGGCIFNAIYSNRFCVTLFLFNLPKLGEKLPNWSEDMDARLNAAMDNAWRRGFVGGGDQVVIVTGWRAGTGATNTVRVLQLPSDRRRLSIVNSQAHLRNVDWFD
ncbi:unnamed protein product [Dicrocoelium dendriticum]|nr:unnamed protein product [Dicrocoelium dendriticum]